MRSQLFGFVVKTQLIYEFLLNCQLSQAVNTMTEFLKQYDSLLVGKSLVPPRFVNYLNDPLTIGLEAHINEWDEEIVQTVNGILAQDALASEFLRMKRIEKSLSWLWPKMRETAVLGHFVFAVTIDNTVLLTVTYGWNDGVVPDDLLAVDNIIPVYVRKMEKMGGYMSAALAAGSDGTTYSQKKKYGPRMDTLITLKNLVEYRRQYLTRKKVEITLKQACQDNNLAMATVKKYAPVLCERWYDHRYEGDVH